MINRDASDVGALKASTLRRIAAPLRQELIAALRTAIVAGEYQPEERLAEKTLCARFGVSRTVVREALRFLEAEGLVRVIPNVGPVVRGISTDEAVALFELRAALEALAAQLFAEKATGPERRRLESAGEAIAKVFAEGNLVDWLRVKNEFYAALTAGSHNEFLSETLLSLQSRVGQLRRVSLSEPGRLPQTVRETAEIVAFAVAGDAEAASNAALRHVKASAAITIRQLRAAEAAEQ